MKSNVGFTELRPGPAGIPSTIGGLGQPFAVTAKTKHADAAAAYVNFMASKQVADIVARSGDLPAVAGGSFAPSARSLEADVYGQLHAVLSTGGPAPYLDYSTPNFYDVIASQIQQLTSGRTSAASVAKALASEDQSYRSSL
jgi:raffinose/stachyose/melibiose transport system substrate-binding protein